MSGCEADLRDRSFSSGEPVDSIETEKSRIVLYELERGWWILAVCWINARSSMKLTMLV